MYENCPRCFFECTLQNPQELVSWVMVETHFGSVNFMWTLRSQLQETAHFGEFDVFILQGTI